MYATYKCRVRVQWEKAMKVADKYSLIVILSLVGVIFILFVIGTVAVVDVCLLSPCDDDLFTDIEVVWMNQTGNGTEIITVPKIQTRRLGLM